MPAWSSGPEVLGVSTRRLKPAAAVSVDAAAVSCGCQLCTGSRLGSTEQPPSDAGTAHSTSSVRAVESDLGAGMCASSMLRCEFIGMIAAEQITGGIGLQLGGYLVDVAQRGAQFAQGWADLINPRSEERRVGKECRA